MQGTRWGIYCYRLYSYCSHFGIKPALVRLAQLLLDYCTCVKFKALRWCRQPSDNQVSLSISSVYEWSLIIRGAGSGYSFMLQPLWNERGGPEISHPCERSLEKYLLFFLKRKGGFLICISPTLICLLMVANSPSPTISLQREFPGPISGCQLLHSEAVTFGKLVIFIVAQFFEFLSVWY